MTTQCGGCNYLPAYSSFCVNFSLTLSLTLPSFLRERTYSYIRTIMHMRTNIYVRTRAYYHLRSHAYVRAVSNALSTELLRKESVRVAIFLGITCIRTRLKCQSVLILVRVIPRSGGLYSYASVLRACPQSIRASATVCAN